MLVRQRRPRFQPETLSPSVAVRPTVSPTIPTTLCGTPDMAWGTRSGKTPRVMDGTLPSKENEREGAKSLYASCMAFSEVMGLSPSRRSRPS